MLGLREGGCLMRHPTTIAFYLPSRAADEIGLPEVWADAETEEQAHGTGRRVCVRASRDEAEGIFQALLDCSHDPKRGTRERSACARGAQRARAALGAIPVPRGCVQRSRAQSTGAIVSVRRLPAPDLDLTPIDEGGHYARQWLVRCETHREEGGVRSLANARTWAARPERWCWGCRKREVA
ncbi:MAG TPA: hypothetical protein VM285_05695 [Polyangia bacterium]|nr:hypothetical protein [Polyangia bacterium]